MKNSIKLICVCLIMVLTFTACNTKSTTSVETTESTITYTTVTENTTTETTTESITEVTEQTATTATTATATTEESSPEETKQVTKDTTQETSATTTTELQTTKPVEVLNAKSMPTFEGPTADELYTLELINAEREKVGLPALTFNYKLYNCAKLRADETEEKLSHTRPNGKKFYTVLEDYGIPHEKCLGENIAFNFKEVDAAFDALMNSQSHKDNILHEMYSSVSIGITELGNGYYSMVQFFEG